MFHVQWVLPVLAVLCQQNTNTRFLWQETGLKSFNNENTVMDFYFIFFLPANNKVVKTPQQSRRRVRLRPTGIALLNFRSLWSPKHQFIRSWTTGIFTHICLTYIRTPTKFLSDVRVKTPPRLAPPDNAELTCLRAWPLYLSMRGMHGICPVL